MATLARLVSAAALLLVLVVGVPAQAAAQLPPGCVQGSVPAARRRAVALLRPDGMERATGGLRAGLHAAVSAEGLLPAHHARRHGVAPAARHEPRLRVRHHQLSADRPGDTRRRRRRARAGGGVSWRHRKDAAARAPDRRLRRRTGRHAAGRAVAGRSSRARWRRARRSAASASRSPTSATSAPCSTTSSPGCCRVRRSRCRSAQRCCSTMRRPGS